MNDYCVDSIRMHGKEILGQNLNELQNNETMLKILGNLLLMCAAMVSKVRESDNQSMINLEKYEENVEIIQNEQIINDEQNQNIFPNSSAYILFYFLFFFFIFFYFFLFVFFLKITK